VPTSPEGRATRIPKRRLAEYRERALVMDEEGFTAEEIAQALRCGRSTVFGWLAAARAGRLPAAPAKPTGRPPRLADEQLDRLRRLLIRDPRQLEFDFGLWTRAMVAELIFRTFGVRLSSSAVGELLRRRLGMSPQRPVWRAAERKPAAVQAWTTETFPAIVAKARAEGAHIWFQDESGVRSDYHAGTSWAPVGCTPVVTTTGQRFSLNMVSSVSPKGELHFRLIDGRLTAETFIDYLTALLHDIPGRIFLVVDGHPAHKAKKTSQFVAGTGDRLTLFFLPGYSPDLNPDEWVWKNVKHDTVGKTGVTTKDQLRDSVLRAIDRLKTSPEIVRGFFGDPCLAYITQALTGVQ
jgi:transposase